MEAKVRIHYKNEHGTVVATRDYAQTDYVDMIRMDLFRVITDIENLYYRLNEGKAKREWRQRDLDEFNVVKHRLLDKAGEIGRLPSAMLLNDLPNGAENELCAGDGLVLLCARPWGETERQGKDVHETN